ncbi:hypothetical protein GA0115239_12843 [Streptomyces sp. BpilaLS-43]|uniref:hypothetical protein n=1 Tax=Streptomyces sp. BpilaLS-43 TaxID=1839778 RepID=UPI00081BBB1A|nr:hypothetical protein [Streptomyces sp. BpilaLS-43]SCE18019.1 hypothetical protein GA0115239_12843 [Streptomyces sp. BpilaLS-43]
MGHWLHQNIVEPGKLPLLLALSAFVLTFAVTRFVTRMIRAGKGPFRDITPGGVHIHHVVPGVVLSVVGGFGAVASGRQGMAAGICAVVFGVGAGLVLDEFALILHLDDVYWTEEGRRSVEVVVLTASLVLLVLAGFSPLGVDELSGDEQQDRLGVVLSYGGNFGFVLIALFKGKARMAVIGTLVPLIAFIAAVRLARPASPWARRLYRNRHRARARALLRAYHHDVRWAGPRRRFQDLIGGAPDRTPLPGPPPEP